MGFFDCPFSNFFIVNYEYPFSFIGISFLKFKLDC